MKRTIISLVLALVILLAQVPLALAAEGQPPVAGCPENFELHPFMDVHQHEHHVGLEADLNADGYICVSHTKSGKHVHVDNVVQ